MQVKDKVVIVTGGGGEIGKVIALTLAERESNILELILAKRRFVKCALCESILQQIWYP